MKTEKTYFRFIGLAEGISLLILLFIAMPLKRIFGFPEAVRWIGSIHGVLFIAYVYTLITFAHGQKWSLKKFFLAFIVASIPFGTIWFDRKYLKAQL